MKQVSSYCDNLKELCFDMIYKCSVSVLCKFYLVHCVLNNYCVVSWCLARRFTFPSFKQYRKVSWGHLKKVRYGWRMFGAFLKNKCSSFWPWPIHLIYVTLLLQTAHLPFLSRSGRNYPLRSNLVSYVRWCEYATLIALTVVSFI